MARAPLTEFDKKIRQTISQNLKRLMNGMTQGKLADLSGIPQSTLSGYLLGNSTPHPDQVEKLADVFKVKKSEIDPRFSTTTTKQNYSPNIVRLVKTANTLNDEGQGKLADYADDLASSGKYSKLSDSPATYTDKNGYIRVMPKEDDIPDEHRWVAESTKNDDHSGDEAIDEFMAEIEKQDIGGSWDE